MIHDPVEDPEMPDDRGPSKNVDRSKCQYKKGGNCVEHGPGAKAKFRPGFKWTAGPDGGRTRTYYRQKYYECDLDPRGKGKLKQTQLTFIKTTPSILVKTTPSLNLSTENTVRRAGGENLNFSSSTPSEGQQTDCGRGSTEELVDENGPAE